MSPKLLNKSRETPPHIEVTYLGRSGERIISKSQLRLFISQVVAYLVSSPSPSISYWLPRINRIPSNWLLLSDFLLHYHLHHSSQIPKVSFQTPQSCSNLLKYHSIQYTSCSQSDLHQTLIPWWCLYLKTFNGSIFCSIANQIQTPLPRFHGSGKTATFSLLSLLQQPTSFPAALQYVGAQVSVWWKPLSPPVLWCLSLE